MATRPPFDVTPQPVRFDVDPQPARFDALPRPARFEVLPTDGPVTVALYPGATTFPGASTFPGLFVAPGSVPRFDVTSQPVRFVATPKKEKTDE